MNLVIMSKHKGGTPKALRKAIPGTIIVNPYADKVKGHALFLNWGTRPEYGKISNAKGYILNNLLATDLAINKLKTFQTLNEHKIPCLEFTDSFGEAKKWLSEGRSVFGRKLLESSAAKGIVLALASHWKEHLKNNNLLPYPADFPNCRIWTKNFPKERELRVHVFGGQVIAYAEKRKVNPDRFKSDSAFNKSLAMPDFWVRNHANGWVYCTEGVKLPSIAEAVSKDAVAALGLDFGAVDLLIGESHVKVCEINTAPGLEGKTLERYVQAITKYKETQ